MSEKYFKIWESSEWLKEKSTQFHIPFTTLQGSRACFPNKEFETSTDYDVRFLYAKDPKDYFRYGIGRSRDTLEHKETLYIDGEEVNAEFVGWDISKFIELGKKSNPHCQSFVENIPMHLKDPVKGTGIFMEMRDFLNYYNSPATLLKSYLGQMKSVRIKTASFYVNQRVETIDISKFQKTIYNCLICLSRLQMVKNYNGRIAPQFDISKNLELSPDKELNGLFWKSLLNRKSMGLEDLREVANWIEDFLSVEACQRYNSYETPPFLKPDVAQEYFVRLVKLFTNTPEILI